MISYMLSLALKIFEQIGHSRDEILEVVRSRKNRMERHKIFSPEQNFNRVEAYFRAQLFQRINTDKIMKRAVIVFAILLYVFRK
jgi:hypothetical protein